MTEEKKTARRRKTTKTVEQPENQPGVDFGTVDFQPVGTGSGVSMEDSAQVNSDICARIGPGVVVERVESNGSLSNTAARLNQHGAFEVIVRAGERVAIPVDPVDITHSVEGSVQLSFETGLLFLGYEDGRVFLMNASRQQAVIRNGAVIATAVLR